MNSPDQTPRSSITDCLRGWRDGDEAALSQLTTEIYRELRRLAASVMKGQARERTIQPTALVHELYFHLPDVQHFDWQSKAHFLNVAAKMMRNILVSHARKRQAAKRGGDLLVAMSDIQGQDSGFNIDVLAVHNALDQFTELYPRQARVVELRFFGGLSVAETCDVFRLTGNECSFRTVERDWTFARAWLEDAIGQR